MVKPGDYQGMVAAKNKVDGEKKARKLYGLSSGVKLHLEFLHADPPYKVYEVTVTTIGKLKDPKMPKGWIKKFNLAFDKRYGAK